MFDLIRDLFASTQDARARGYKQGRFSFNVRGGRCEACSGDGVNRIEMHFLPDIYVTCDVCKGTPLQPRDAGGPLQGQEYRRCAGHDGRRSAGVSSKASRASPASCRPCIDVGLGYIRLGQPSTQLSGGEAQRVKLATELSRRGTGKTFYILDEPTTGLHVADVHKLVDILRRLTENGNTVLVIEHNLDVIKTADYIIDLGPEGGDAGGYVIAEGTPEAGRRSPASYTGQYLQPDPRRLPDQEPAVRTAARPDIIQARKRAEKEKEYKIEWLNVSCAKRMSRSSSRPDLRTASASARASA